MFLIHFFFCTLGCALANPAHPVDPPMVQYDVNIVNNSLKLIFVILC